MHQSSILQRMASTHGGMRNILKKKPSTVQFIKWSVETGVHKDLHEDETFKRGGNRNNRNQRDDRNNRKPKFAKYPIEYEILTLNPPIPEMPRIPKKMQRKEKAALPTDKLVKNYMRRYDARMKASTILTDAEREEYYYRKTLGTSQKGEGSNDVSSAMGRKSAVLTHAYDFALKQFEVMQNNEGLTEQGSISMVEELLANEEKVERLLSREKTTTLVKEKKVAKEIHASHDSSNADAIPPPSSTIPSILHAKPRTIQALSIWGKRFKAVPYSQWTLGASTALDHWIAVDVLGMTEETWNRLLNGELEIDIEQSRGVEVNIGDLARNRDIVTVRSTLFPETMIDMVDDMDDDDNYEEDMMLDEQSEKDATDRSIDELLASLGGFDDIGEDNANSTDDVDSRISKMIDSLQDWRVMNEKAPFKDWDSSAKGEFNVSSLESFSIYSTQLSISHFSHLSFQFRNGSVITLVLLQRRQMDKLILKPLVKHYFLNLLGTAMNLKHFGLKSTMKPTLKSYFITLLSKGQLHQQLKNHLQRRMLENLSRVS